MAGAAAARREIERRSGVALWRQIADRIRIEIASGSLDAQGKLPPEIELSARFGVNRHTVRAAIAALVQEGVLRAEQGRGTFVADRRRLTYPITARTRFSTGLADQIRERRSTLLDHASEPASERVAQALELAPGQEVLRIETLSEADGRPLSRATSWFDAGRFPGFELAYQETQSVTAAFKRYGIDDYLRRSTIVSARHADPADLADLRLSPGAIVLVTVAVNVDTQGRPIQFSETRFAADRVELSVSTEA
jgi:GntR family transcriptional regulator, phosphonate transport system regulatory protein